MNHKINQGLACFAVLLAVGVGASWVQAEAEEDQATSQDKAWDIVFDGTSTEALRDFKTDDFPKNGWAIEADGSLRAVDGAVDIVTRKQYSDFDLRMEWKLGKGANSGIMYRVAQRGNHPHDTGPEYQIIDDPRIHMSSTGSLYGLIKPNENAKANPAGNWNSSRIVLKDNRVQHYLNGELVVEYVWGSDDIKARLKRSKFRSWKGYMQQETGFIGFQSHGKDLWLRNIKVKDLSGEGAEQ
ncbi:MAG: DUF1080 domain-containing protein [Planctomycetota bacterium]